jgi:hypothetical protein
MRTRNRLIGAHVEAFGDDARAARLRRLGDAIAQARSEGATFQDIGDVLGVTRQEAHRLCTQYAAVPEAAT